MGLKGILGGNFITESGNNFDCQTNGMFYAQALCRRYQWGIFYSLPASSD